MARELVEARTFVLPNRARGEHLAKQQCLSRFITAEKIFCGRK